MNVPKWGYQLLAWNLKSPCKVQVWQGFWDEADCGFWYNLCACTGFMWSIQDLICLWEISLICLSRLRLTSRFPTVELRSTFKKNSCQPTKPHQGRWSYFLQWQESSRWLRPQPAANFQFVLRIHSIFLGEQKGKKKKKKEVCITSKDILCFLVPSEDWQDYSRRT